MKKLLFLVTVLMLFSCSETRMFERSLNSLESNVFTREQLQSVGLTVSMLETLYNGADTMTKEQETEYIRSYYTFIQGMSAVMQEQGKAFRVWCRFYFEPDGTPGRCLMRFFKEDELSIDFQQSFIQFLRGYMKNNKLNYTLGRRSAFCSTINFETGKQ